MGRISCQSNGEDTFLRLFISLEPLLREETSIKTKIEIGITQKKVAAQHSIQTCVSVQRAVANFGLPPCS